MQIEIKNTVTIENVLDDAENVYYSARGCWWTTDATDLYFLVDGQAKHVSELEQEQAEKVYHLPCDPSGCPLFMTNEARAFVEAAQLKPDHYGKHGLNAFFLAHAKNLTINGKGVSFESWTAYDSLLDEAQTRNTNSFTAEI